MIRIILGVISGGVLGFAVSLIGKCTTGACPITRNPLIGMVLGALIGFLITIGGPDKK